MLLPKKGKPIQAGDYCPITITPLVTCLVHWVLSKHLTKAAPLPQHQRGFKEEEGCSANLLILRSLIRKVKVGPSNLYVAFTACRRWGLPPHIVKYVGNVCCR